MLKTNVAIWRQAECGRETISWVGIEVVGSAVESRAACSESSSASIGELDPRTAELVVGEVCASQSVAISGAQANPVARASLKSS